MPLRVLLLVSSMTLAGCTAADRVVPEPSTSPERTYDMPVALVVHHGRDVDELSAADAEAVIAGKIDDWAELGQKAGPMRVVGAVPEAKGVETADDASAVVDTVADDRSAIGIVPADAVTPRVRAIEVDGLDALRGDPRYPLTTPVADIPEPVLVTAITGDIMLGRRVGQYLRAEDDPAKVMRPFANRLAAADVTVGNLESTLSTDGSPTQGGDSFGTDPSAIRALELAGFDVVSLANNHFGDFGRRAMLDTVRTLVDSRIKPVGGGRNLAKARGPAVVERRGVRIGFIATDSIGETPRARRDSPGTNRINAPPRTGPLDQRALNRVRGDIRRLDGKVEVVVVLAHWGDQYTNQPVGSQRRIARAFVDAGADLVVGGHPHWVQGWEPIGESTVVHSLGNFVFDMDFMRETQEGLLLEMVTRGDTVVALDTTPYVIGTRDFTPRPVKDRGRVKAIYDLVRESSRPPFDELRP
ncbi:CapA family protein [Aeromicrobium sp.]|uniref:CapA family protein n=1 Tax=Aeromicrobium sp. TaxID=1871063 RepID=UPI003D6AED53